MVASRRILVNMAAPLNHRSTRVTRRNYRRHRFQTRRQSNRHEISHRNRIAGYRARKYFIDNRLRDSDRHANCSSNIQESAPFGFHLANMSNSLLITSLQA